MASAAPPAFCRRSASRALASTVPWFSLRSDQEDAAPAAGAGGSSAMLVSWLTARSSSGVVWTAGRHLVHFWENPVGLLRPLHLGRRGRPLEEDGILRVLPLRLVSGLGSLLFLLRALRGRRVLLQLLLLRLLPGNLLLLLLLLLCFPRSGTRWVRGVPLLG